MFSIGEFSRITGLSVKTLRFYHEKGLLVPPRVDPDTGYRYYDAAAVEHARIVVRLRAMEFSVEEIARILEGCEDETDLLDHLERKKQSLAERIRRQREALASLEAIIAREKEAQKAMQHPGTNVEEKTLGPMLVAGIRMKGRYGDCGRGFARLGRSLGRRICGPALCLYYDPEYREDDADFEACMPVRDGKPVDGIATRELPGCRCVSLVHRGPYEELGRSYEKVFEYIRARGYRTALPSREVYLKGPGMIFRGNPKNYLTEIQVPLCE